MTSHRNYPRANPTAYICGTEGHSPPVGRQTLTGCPLLLMLLLLPLLCSCRGCGVHCQAVNSDNRRKSVWSLYQVVGPCQFMQGDAWKPSCTSRATLKAQEHNQPAAQIQGHLPYTTRETDPSCQSTLRQNKILLSFRGCKAPLRRVLQIWTQCCAELLRKCSDAFSNW